MDWLMALRHTGMVAWCLPVGRVLGLGTGEPVAFKELYMLVAAVATWSLKKVGRKEDPNLL